MQGSYTPALIYLLVVQLLFKTHTYWYCLSRTSTNNRWEQFLDIPEEVAAGLSSECLDFMLSLLADSKERWVIAVHAAFVLLGLYCSGVHVLH